ncbi:MAG: dienelactone hydrolase family protein [Acidimicrobiales bacterium]|nr:dienelactone hydrolase family protein [Acidimicrobiales bacterium]
MRITLASGTPAEFAAPSGEASRGLVVFPDIGGLRPLFDELCARLARENGWAVCAPEPWPAHTDQPLEWRLEHVGDLDDKRVLADVVAAADATGCDTVGIVGFCMGGMYALKAAGTGRFHRAVSFYGMIRVPQRWASPTQGQPLEYLTRPEACPVLAIIGTADIWTPPEDVAALEAAGATVVRYEGAEHGFVHDPDRPAHRPDDAADAWQRAIAFLSE